MVRLVAWTKTPGTERAFQHCQEGVINVSGQSQGAIARVGEPDYPNSSV